MIVYCPNCLEEIPIEEVTEQRKCTGRPFVHVDCLGSFGARMTARVVIAEKRLAIAMNALKRTECTHVFRCDAKLDNDGTLDLNTCTSNREIKAVISEIERERDGDK